MVKESGLSQGFFYCLEGRFAFGCPSEFLGFSFQGVVEVIEVFGGATDVAPVVPHHTEESLEFLDGGGSFGGPDCLDFVGERNDAVLVDVEPKEVEFADAEDAFCAIDH